MKENKNSKAGLIIAILAAVLVITIAAVATVIIILGGNEKKLEKQLERGNEYLHEMNYEEAVMCFEKALDIDPESAKAYIGISDAYMGLDEYEEAINIIKDGIDYLSNNSSADSNTNRTIKIKRLQSRLELLSEETEAKTGSSEMNSGVTGNSQISQPDINSTQTQISLNSSHKPASQLNTDTIKALLDITTDGYVGGFSFCMHDNYDKYIGYAQSKYNVGKGDGYYMSINDAKDIMKNTVGYENIDSFDTAQGYVWKDAYSVYFMMHDWGESWKDDFEIISIEDISGDRYKVVAKQVEGLAGYLDTNVSTYEMVLSDNPESVFDGLTVNGVVLISKDVCYLPYAQTRVYDFDDLMWGFEMLMPEDVQREYRIARNEIFAHHGRKFNDPDLRNHFEGQSWYTPMYDDVPIERLSDIERQNIAVLDAVKAELVRMGLW